MKMLTFIKNKDFSRLTLLWTFIKTKYKKDAQWCMKLAVPFFARCNARVFVLV